MLPEHTPLYRRLLEPNPVLVRELKQFVRNRLLLYFMLAYLGVLSVVAIIAMIDDSLLGFVETLTLGLARFHNQTGEGLFRSVMVGYFVFTSIFLILFGAIKMGFERLKNDLGYYTTLPPWRVISGKFLLGVTVSAIFLSIALPFLTIAYMMRGIGLDVIVTSAIYFFLYTLIQYSITLAFFAGAKTLRRIYLFGAALLLIHFLAFFFGFALGSEYMDGIYIRGGQAVSGFFIEGLFILMPLPLAVCQVSPESTNRMLPIRLAMAAMVLLFVLSVFAQFFIARIGYFAGFGTGLKNMFYGLGFCTYFIMPYMVLIGLCERERYTIRQRLRIPKSIIGRMLLFPFGTGVYNAMACFLGYILFLGTFYLFLEHGPTIGGISSVIDQSFVDQVLKVCVPFSIILFDYALTAFLLWKVALHRFISREWLAFGIMGLSVGFYVMLFILEMFVSYSYQWIEGLFESCFFLPIIIAITPRHEHVLFYQLILGLFWGVILCAIMALPWLRAFGRFTRYQGTQLSPPEHRDHFETTAANASPGDAANSTLSTPKS